MKHIALIITFVAFCLALPTFAQQKKKVSTATTQTAEQLIQHYKFSEAARVLQREIDVARSTGKATTRLEADLKRANLGADMLRGTEKVEFIDSIKVGRNEVLNHIHLSAESGRFVMMSEETENFSNQKLSFGKCGHINELNNRIIFSLMDSLNNVKNLYNAYRSGQHWGTPSPLDGMQNTFADQDFPFMMPDGVTLYYAAQGNESLGGYDIFVTRYNAETKQYLKAENIGMPFNSPANDYLLAIDEQNNLGWLVTDRNQKADSVCIYVFIPSSTREVYDLNNANIKNITQVAQLHSIAETQKDKKIVTEAKKRLKKLLTSDIQTTTNTARIYIINDQTVYTKLNQFKSESAQRIALQADKVLDKITILKSKQDNIMRSFAQGKRTSQKVQELTYINQTLAKLQEQYHTLCKNMRKAELQ